MRPALARAGLIALLALALFWPHLFRPMGGDPSVYAYIGRAILRGDVPYRDAWDIKSPAIYFQYATALGLLGDRDRAVHLAELALVVATALVVGAAASRVAGAWAGLLGAITWLAAFHRFQAEGSHGQPETAAALLGAGVLALALRPGPLALRECLLAGALAAALSWYKPPFALLAAPILARWPATRSAGTAGRAVAGAAFAFAAVGLVIAGYFAAHGALGDLWQGAIAAPARVAAANPSTWRWHVGHLLAAAAMLCRWLPATILLAAAGAVVLLQERREGAVPVASQAAIAIALVVVQANYFAYHWIPLLPSLAVLAGAGAEAVFTRLAAVVRSRAARAAAMAMLLVAFEWSWALFYWQGYLAGVSRRDPSEFLRRLATPCGDEVKLSAAAIVALGEHLRDATRPGDTILPFDLAPAIDFYAERRRPSRFVYLWPLEHPALVHLGWRAEFDQAVMREKPAYVIVCRRSARANFARDGLRKLTEWPGLGPWFTAGYALETTLGPLEVYRRRGHEAP